MIRSVPLRRHALVRRRVVTLHRGPRRDPVTPEMREAILRRDQECLLHQFDAKHVCRDQWGRPHAPWATGMLSIEHVHEGYGMTSKRAPSRMDSMVAICHWGNVAVPSKEARAFFREYLARVEA